MRKARLVSEITRLYIAKQYSEADAGSVQRALQVRPRELE